MALRAALRQQADWRRYSIHRMVERAASRLCGGPSPSVLKAAQIEPKKFVTFS